VILAYRFRRKDKSVEAALRRIAREQLVKTLGLLDEGELGPEAVHEVRARCKKLRALLRLVRPSLRHFGREDEAFRDAARLLAPARDYEVLQATLARLLASAGNRLGERLGPALTGPELAPPAAPPDRTAIDGCRELLNDALRRSRAWELTDEGWPALGPGLARTLGQAQAELDAAQREPGGEAFHALRKQAKYHFHHVSLLARLDPAAFRKRGKHARLLCELLGEEHDLAVLSAHLAGSDPDRPWTDPTEAVQVLIRRKRTYLAHDALAAAQRLFAGKPEELREEWGKLWTKWH